MRGRTKKRKKQDIIVEVNVKKLLLFLILIGMTVLTLLGGVRLVKGFMRVKYFEMKGISVYELTDPTAVARYLE